MAIEQGMVTEKEMDAIMYAPMSEQFNAYWKQENELMSQLWYRMIYCLQFKGPRKKIEKFEDNPSLHQQEINLLYEKCRKKFKLRYYRKKINIVFKRMHLK